jgi:hypothetical protein
MCLSLSVERIYGIFNEMTQPVTSTFVDRLSTMVALARCRSGNRIVGRDTLEPLRGCVRGSRLQPLSRQSNFAVNVLPYGRRKIELLKRGMEG